MIIKNAKFYPKSRTLHKWHHMLTLTDPRIHDYLVAAPILILPLTEGANYNNKKHRAFVCRRAGEISHRGEKLKSLLKKYNIANPLRKISRECITPSYKILFDYLGTIPPSTLSQAIPQTTKGQIHYFKNLMKFLNRMAQRGTGIRPNETFWAVRNMNHSQGDHADDLADYFMYLRHAANTDFKFTFQTALKRMEEWHEQRISQSQLEKCEVTFGVRHDYPVPYAPMPEQMPVDGFEFVALQTYKDLLLEAEQMHHCVGSYFHDVLNLGSRIYSIQKDGEKLATLEYHHKYDNPRGLQNARLRPGQLKGKCNSKPSNEIQNAVNEFSAICRGNKWFDLVQPEGRG